METPNLYQFKVSLPEVSPPVWRQIVVPANIPLDRLHDVIQIVMGWTDSHLYEFTIGSRHYMEMPEGPEDGEAAGTACLGEVIDEAKGRFVYTYDFGDSWQHLVVAEKPGPDADLPFMPVFCLDGKRACPPENIGGPMGYEAFCEAIKDKKHPEHLDMKQWYADATGATTPFKPEAFDVDDVNRRLSQYLRWNRPRPLPWIF